MLNQEDLKWIATTSTELNSLLQQIARYADLARQHKGQHAYLEMLSDRVDQAAKNAQSLFDRVTSGIMRGSAAGASQEEKTPIRKSTPLSVVRPEEAKTASAKSESAASVENAKENGSPADIHIHNGAGGRELIMIVDDEAEIADLACEMLAEEGYKVIVARDGFEALKIYQSAKAQIGLVILDFFLPVMDGDAVFEELKALNPNVNVVLSSGFAEQSKIGAMLAQGLRGFIPKPYSREKLLDQVRQTLDAARRPL